MSGQDEKGIEMAKKADGKSEEKKLDDKPLQDASAPGIFIPDIPLPAEDAGERDIVEDECDAAFKLAFVGTGQGGARMAEAFYALGYRRVCAVNTTEKDLVHIKIPDENKLVMDIGEDGAGKDPQKGEAAVKEYYEDVYDLMRRSFGRDFERIIVCAGAGGGTGSGSVQSIIKIAHDIAESFRLEGAGQPPAVGALVSMPMKSEGQKVNANAHDVLSGLFGLVGKGQVPGKLAGRTLSPLIVVDNDRINEMYPGLPVTQFYGVANQSISGLFHLFNNIATRDSELTTFDKADLADVLKSGVVTFGATYLKEWMKPTDISYAVRDNLKRNILVADIDLRVAEAAACVVVGHESVLDVVPQENLEHGFEMLSRIMQENSVVHRGIYKGPVADRQGKPTMVVYTILGELGIPQERMDEIARIGKKGQQPGR